MASLPILQFGAAGWTVENLDPAKEFLEILERHGVKHIDTARMYTGSEETLGKLGAPKKFTIHTKAMGFFPKSLSRESVFKGQKESFEDLKTDSVETYFLHAPDTTVPIEETLGALNELYIAGKFKRLGLSNFSPEQVREAYDTSKAKGWVLPTVFQGNYNPVSRHVETRLFPLLRELGIRFWAYSAIAGGFLSKTADQIAAGGEGRWDPETMVGGLYHRLYNRPALIEGLREWGLIARDTGLSGTELAFRYMRYHSFLKGEYGDGIIVGASKPSQLEQSLEYLEKGPLPQSTVDRIEKVWEMVKDEAPYDNAEEFGKDLPKPE